MNRFRNILVVIVTGVFLVSEARAWGPHFEMTAFPSYVQTNRGALGDMGGNFDGTTLNSESGISYDLRNTFGVKPNPWLMVGITYNYAKSPLKREVSQAASSLDRTLKNSEWGPSVGLFYDNIRVVGTLLLSGSKTFTDRAVAEDGSLTSDQEIKNTLKSGFQLTLGYSFSITQNLKLGPSLVYRRATYESQSLTNNVEPSLNYTDKVMTTPAVDGGLLPMVSLILTF